MMAITASFLTLLGALLFYLTDREQRLLEPSLGIWWRLGSLVCVILSTWFWSQLLGAGPGLMVGLWGSSLSALLLVLVIGHQQDSFQKTGGRT